MNSHKLIAVVISFFLVLPVLAQDGINGNLVSVKWLGKNLKNPKVLILDVSTPQRYAAQHIPGAISVHLFSYGIKELPLADIEDLYRSWGVSAGKKIVIYDQGGSSNTTRFFYNLYYYGYTVKDLFILDGGLSKWQETKLAVTKDSTSAPTRGTFKITKIKEEARVRLPEFLTASGDPEKNALVEGLDANWHFGQISVFDKNGHIPNGIMLPGDDFYNPDKTFKSAAEIENMVKYMGVGPEESVYTYCGGGVAATVPYFAFKFILKYPRVKVYTESEMGWLQDDRGLPYWTYDVPYLVRDTKWLQFWGGRMLRMYMGAQVSIVDVRPAGVFQQGHIPLALNIPADMFRDKIGDPIKLAAVLGHAGVNASHEAVIVSGAGLTKESALAFVMLEKLGQKRVSVFLDSVERWEQLGFPVIKETSAVVPKEGLQDLSMAASKYSVHLRKEVIIADPKSTKGVYPKVFIASGKDVPAKSQERTVVHMPYSDLLNPGGSPKEAKEIWNILVKAGVPRYAELVCYSDDPGEAAVNYVIMKLMGYPDVKVMVM